MNDELKQLADFLSEYHDWKLEAKKIAPGVGSPAIDGMPKGSAHDPNVALDAHANAKNECWKREAVIKNLREVGDDYAMLADIIDWRYLHGFSLHKVQHRVYEKWNWDISDKTLRRKQIDGLKLALQIIPSTWLANWVPIKK